MRTAYKATTQAYSREREHRKMAFIVVLFSIINFKVQTHRNIKFTFKLLPKGSRSLVVDVNDFIVLIY